MHLFQRIGKCDFFDPAVSETVFFNAFHAVRYLDTLENFAVFERLCHDCPQGGGKPDALYRSVSEGFSSAGRSVNGLFLAELLQALIQLHTSQPSALFKRACADLLHACGEDDLLEAASEKAFRPDLFESARKLDVL